MGADNDLSSLFSADSHSVAIARPRKPTGWLLPGSLTVTNCSSLYFSKAGPSSDAMSGDVRALISATTSASYETKVSRASGKLALLALRKPGAGRTLLTSPGGAPSTKDETMSSCDMATAND